MEGGYSAPPSSLDEAASPLRLDGRRPLCDRGEVSYRIFRSIDDPNVVTVMSVQQSAEQVQAFLDSPDLDYSAGTE